MVAKVHVDWMLEHERLLAVLSALDGNKILSGSPKLINVRVFFSYFVSFCMLMQVV